jgi:integrase
MPITPVRQRGRRVASARRTDVLFVEFARWGWDFKGWSPRTRQHYGDIARSADRWLVEERHVSLMWARTKDLKAYLFSRSPNARTRNSYRQALVGFGHFLVEQEVRDENPATALPRLPDVPPLPRPLDTGVARKLASSARIVAGIGGTFALTLLYTGARHSEGRLLEWRSLTQEGWVRLLGKGSKQRDVPLHPVLRHMLRNWRRECPDPRWVFPSLRHEGAPACESTTRRYLQEVGELAGIPHLTAHVLRHTFATRLLEQTSDLRVVQVALGHSNPKSTTIYTLVRPPRLEDAFDKLDFLDRY